MTEASVRDWYDTYLEAFAACGRGERDPEALLTFYAAPLLLSTDAQATLLPDRGAVIEAARRMVTAMQAARYDHSDVVSIDVEQLNATTALVRGAFIRRRADGSEIEPLTATYVVAESDTGPRIATLAVHSAA